MTVPVLRKIRELVNNGAIVLGPKPLKSPSLANYPNADREVETVAQDLWGDLDGVSRTKRTYGKGTVVWGLSPADVLASLHTPKDVEYTRALDANVSWVHRRTADADIYFVANRTDRHQEMDVRFRVSGKEAEFWHADTGEIEPAEFSIADGRTTVPLHLSERESVLVVFRRATSASSRTLPRPSVTKLVTVDETWTISLAPLRERSSQHRGTFV